MKIVDYLLIAIFCLPVGCAGFPGTSANVSRNPQVADYMRTHKALVKKCDILRSARTSILVEHGRRYAKHDGFHLEHTLPAGSRIVISRIDRIQGDGFVLFKATGKVFPAGLPKGISFSYEWGHGGTSPQAPWEQPGERLKKTLGIE